MREFTIYLFGRQKHLNFPIYNLTYRDSRSIHHGIILQDLLAGTHERKISPSFIEKNAVVTIGEVHSVSDVTSSCATVAVQCDAPVRPVMYAAANEEKIMVFPGSADVSMRHYGSLADFDSLVLGNMDNSSLADLEYIVLE